MHRTDDAEVLTVDRSGGDNRWQGNLPCCRVVNYVRYRVDCRGKNLSMKNLLPNEFYTSKVSRVIRLNEVTLKGVEK